MSKNSSSGEAASLRAYYSEVPEEVREAIFTEILACEVNGDPDAFERLTVRILAYQAAYRFPPSVGKVCHDLLALIGHSIVARKTSTASVSVTASVSRTLTQADKLKDAVRRKLPDYGNLEDFLENHDDEPDVIDVEPVKTEDRPTVRLSRRGQKEST